MSDKIISLNGSPAQTGEKQKAKRRVVAVAPYIYKREPEDTYFCRFRLDGTLHCSGSFGTDFKLAKVKAEDWRRQVKQGAQQRALSDPRKGNFKSWADCETAFRADLDFRVETRQLATESRRFRISRLIALSRTWREVHGDELAPLLITKITPQDCKRWAAEYAQQYEATNFNNTLATLIDVLQIAVAAGRLVTNPAAGIKRMAIEVKPTRVPSVEEFRLILHQMRHGETKGLDGKWYRSKATKHADLAEVLAYTMSRHHEVAYKIGVKGKRGQNVPESAKVGGLRWKDVLWEKRCVRLYRQKSHLARHGTNLREQLFPFWGPLEETLKRLRAESPEAGPEDLVAPAPECYHQMRRAIACLKAEGKLDAEFPDNLDHHDLRKACATWMLSWNVPVPHVARLLGHRDNGVTLLKSYAHVIASQELEALSKASSAWLQAA